MPTLDLSEIANDPEFTSTFTRLRPTVALVTGTEGRTTSTYASSTCTGIVTPGDRPDSMGDAPEGESADNWITVISTTPILLAGDASSCDIVEWAGAKYRVRSVEPFGAYGYQVANCQAYSEDAPTQADPAEDEDAP
jgi:hypothetical protein